MCSIFYRWLSSSIRNNLFFNFGLIIGVFLSAFTSQILQNSCLFSTQVFISSTFEKLSSVGYVKDDYEPRINLIGKPLKAQKTPQEFLRPRYYTTELGMKEKLFVAVLTSPSTVQTFGLAFNKTLTHLVDKTMFFMESDVNHKKTNVSLNGVVQFSDTRSILKPFHLLKYIEDNFLEDYDYFFIVRDTTYVNGRRLLNLVRQISVSEHVHAGVGQEDLINFCLIDAGILLSNSVLKKTTQNLDWCVKNAYSTSDDANLGRCILHSTNIVCQRNVQGLRLKMYDFKNSSNSDFVNFINDDEFTSSITFRTMSDVLTMYKLHGYFSKADLRKTKLEISTIRRSITSKSDSNQTWPVGNQPYNKPKNRFDVIRWEYFNATHVFLKNDFSVVDILEGADLIDLQYIINNTVRQLESKYFGQIQYRTLVNGYRKFDPSRGMDYILDLSFRDVTSDRDVFKRVQVCKPLGKTEIVPVQYVTENTRVNMVLFVRESNMRQIVTFVNNYVTVCMEKHDKTFLMLVLLYEADRPGKGTKDDVYGDIKSLAVKYSDRFKKDSSKIAWLSVKLPDLARTLDTDGVLTVSLVDLVVKKFTGDNLILLCSENMELRQDYLNRVRMNTIKERQIFSPVPFQEFSPLVVYSYEQPRPKELDINKNYGHYDDKNYYHVSFYVKDYQAARKNTEHVIPLVRTDKDIHFTLWQTNTKQQSTNITVDLTMYNLFTLFVKNSQVNVLRAVDPGLRLRYVENICMYNQTSVLYKHCVQHRNDNLGTKSHLAQLMLDYLSSRSKIGS